MLSKGHTYSLIFSGTVAVSANGDDKTCVVSLAKSEHKFDLQGVFMGYLDPCNENQIRDKLFLILIFLRLGE